MIENNFDIELSSENIFALVDLVVLQTGRSVHLKENIIATRERNELGSSKNQVFRNPKNTTTKLKLVKRSKFMEK